MGIFSDRRRSGSFLVHPYEVFKRVYGNKVHNTDDSRDDIQFPFSVAGDQDSASGNGLRSLDWNRSSGSSHSWDRAV